MAQRPVVLLVDDDRQMRDFLAALFSAHGRFRIGGVAADGLEAAMLAADLAPDVVVLDYFMPRWDGAKAAEFIRTRCRRTKIIAFSAVLEEPPEWADAFVLKTRAEELLAVADELAAASV